MSSFKPAWPPLSRAKLACHANDALEARFAAADGRVAQRESTALTWQGPQVQSLALTYVHRCRAHHPPNPVAIGRSAALVQRAFFVASSNTLHASVTRRSAVSV